MLIDELINEIIEIDNELKDDNTWINYHFKIQYNELDKQLLIIVVDDDDVVDGGIMYETKKGLFYLIECNNITYLLHDYKDNTISVKAIL